MGTFHKGVPVGGGDSLVGRDIRFRINVDICPAEVQVRRAVAGTILGIRGVRHCVFPESGEISLVLNGDIRRMSNKVEGICRQVKDILVEKGYLEESSNLPDPLFS